MKKMISCEDISVHSCCCSWRFEASAVSLRQEMIGVAFEEAREPASEQAS